MATSYPYTSAQGALVKAFEQFRKAFPATLESATLKRFNIAPGNESYVINTFRFLGLIDETGKKTEGITDFFYGTDEDFRAGLDKLLNQSYSTLFEEHGAKAWDEPKDTLTVWFRVVDKTSELIGKRQAATFLTLAALAGHGDTTKALANGAASSSAKPGNGSEPRPHKPADNGGKKTVIGARGTDNALPGRNREEKVPEQVGLTVRIEVNLPAGGTPAVYDAIFASIRKNLIDRD